MRRLDRPCVVVVARTRRRDAASALASGASAGAAATGTTAGAAASCIVDKHSGSASAHGSVSIGRGAGPTDGRLALQTRSVVSVHASVSHLGGGHGRGQGRHEGNEEDEDTTAALHDYCNGVWRLSAMRVCGEGGGERERDRGQQWIETMYFDESVPCDGFEP